MTNVHDNIIFTLNTEHSAVKIVYNKTCTHYTTYYGQVKGNINNTS